MYIDLLRSPLDLGFKNLGHTFTLTFWRSTHTNYLRCVELSGARKLLFWADNCVGQNKNWVLFTVLASCVNAVWGPDRITLRYLEKGHTFMKADSVHGQIGKKLKKAGEVITFDELCDLCEKSGSSIKVVTMSCTDFKKCTSGVRSRRTSNETTLPKINGICEAVFTKGSRKMQYREGSCTSELKEVDFLSQRFKLLDLGSSGQPKPRGIRPSKKDGILQLLSSSGVTPAKMRFWHDLVENKAAADLVTNE